MMQQRPACYILEGHEPVPAEDKIAWSIWFETADRVVQQDRVGSIAVSTVFLALDPRLGFGNGPPRLFETMVLDRGEIAVQKRYVTWDQAVHGHKVAMRYARRRLARAQRLLETRTVHG